MNERTDGRTDRRTQTQTNERTQNKQTHCFCVVSLQTLILLQQFDVTVDRSVTGYIHLLAGTIYTVDPIVYILVRKASWKRCREILCLNCSHEDAT